MQRAIVLSVLAIAGSLSTVALPAEASTAYRYWSYWTAEPGDVTWRYAAEGSGTRIPADGAVEGWRFGIAGDDARIQPGPTPDFATICAGVEAPAEGKRVAVVIDTGSDAEAPEGESPSPVAIECVVTAESTTGLRILQEISEVRMDAGFVCGIDGYPARECAPLVDLSTQAPTGTEPSDTDSSAAQLNAASEMNPSTDTGTPLVTAAVLSIVALAGFGIWRRRRRVRT